MKRPTKKTFQLMKKCPPCEMFAKGTKAPVIPIYRTFAEEVRTQGPYTKEPVPSEAHCLIYGKGKQGHQRPLVAQVWGGNSPYPMMTAQYTADFIVKACNTHDKLLTATMELLGYCERYLGPMICGGTMTKARAVIKKAQEEK